MAYMEVMDPVTGTLHTPHIGKVTAKPLTGVEGETFEAFRDRLLLRWVAEKNSHGWCETFDHIMIRNMGYTAKEVNEARARYDYQHSASLTFTSPREITNRRSIHDYFRRYLRDYFGIEDTHAAAANMTLINGPTPLPEGATELERYKTQTLLGIIASRGRESEKNVVLLALGYTTEQIAAAKASGKWTYKLDLNWHCQARINDEAYFRSNTMDRIRYWDGVPGCEGITATVTPGTTIGIVAGPARTTDEDPDYDDDED